MNPTSSQRFKEEKSDNPGPGNYTYDDAFKKASIKIKNSQMSMPSLKSHFGVNAKMADQAPKEQRDKPGPGMYDLPSDFGDWRRNQHVAKPNLSKSKSERNINNKKSSD